MRIINTAPVEFPMAAAVVPNSFYEGGGDAAAYIGGMPHEREWDDRRSLGQSMGDPPPRRMPRRMAAARPVEGAPPPMAGAPPMAVPVPARPLRASAAPKKDLAKQIEQLAEQKEKGILSEAEFKTAKEKLLGD